MPLKRRRDTQTVIPLRSLLAALALTLVSCATDTLEGRVLLSGSSTLAPLLNKSVAQWKSLHPKVDVRVEAIGSDAGLDRLIQYNDADLALLSRPLSDQDQELARAAGKTLVALPLAWDAISLVVPSSNTWARSLTSDQVVLAFTSAVLWSDVDPQWPATPIHRFVLGPRSGTSDLFAARLLAGDKKRLYGALTQTSEDDRILARGLAQVEGSIGFLGWATVQQTQLSLRVLALDGVEPTASSISDGTYGLPRQLWLVGDASTWRTQAALRSLVHYFYDQYENLVVGTPLVGLTAEELRSVDRLLNETL